MPLDLTTGRVALIVVDIQAGATNGESALDHVGQHEAVPRAVSVLRAARALGLPVIHFKEVHRKELVDFGREQWANLGKILYTLEALGTEGKLTSDVFVSLHDKKMPLHQESTFFDWAASKGLDRKKVEDTYKSFGVSSKMNRARQLAKAYNVQSVPVVYVDGKFQVSADGAGSLPQARLWTKLNERLAPACL